MRNFQFYSTLAPFIDGLISEKRAMGFKYDTEAYIFRKLDTYWSGCSFDSAEITAERLEPWLAPSGNESVSSVSTRTYAVRQLVLYMNSRGISAYIPLNKGKRHKPAAYILNKDEIKELFEVIDQYRPARPTTVSNRMADEYPIIFRLILSTGLRRSEAASIRLTDVDTESGTIKIINAKGSKDRVIYLSDDMLDMIKEYIRILTGYSLEDNEWLFPGSNKGSHVSSGSLGIKFSSFWKETMSGKSAVSHPTVHSLRHTYVVMRINSWMENGIDFNVMLPYLSRSLGHKSPNETYYYYHQVASAFKIIHKKDTMAGDVIPKVRVR